MERRACRYEPPDFLFVRGISCNVTIKLSADRPVRSAGTDHGPTELRKAVDSPAMPAKDLVELGANAVEGRLELVLQLPRMRKLQSCELIRKELPVAQKRFREGNRADWYALPLIVQ